VRRGYAKEGDLLVTVQKPKFGREGKNVLGEPLPSKPVSVPRVVAGMNVMVEGGDRYITRVTGLVEVFKDEKGTLHIQAKRFRHGSFTVSLAGDEMTAFLSLTPPLGGGREVGVGTVLDAGKLVLVANGKNKAKPIADALEGPVSCMCTGSAVQLHPDVSIFIDGDAAGQLKMRDYYEWIQSKKPAAPMGM